MQVTDIVKSKKTQLKQPAVGLSLGVKEFRALNVPGVKHAKQGRCFVRVTDLPPQLDQFMEVNPRVPGRTVKGALTGPVVAGIQETLRESPSTLVLKNRGIYLLVDSVSYDYATGQLKLKLTDRGQHGIVDGGHTYAAIRAAVEAASPEELQELGQAYVQLHILEGIEPDLVAEIAEGLNRSKQVDDPSLMNLQGEFDIIRKVLRGTPAADAIAYHQGSEAPVYVTEILGYLSLFNIERFTDAKHPAGIYNKASLATRYFSEDMAEHRRATLARIRLLPDILWLADTIRKLTPDAARRAGLKFGMAKSGGERLGGYKQAGMRLHYLQEDLEYKVPNGWMLPMLAAFRANLRMTRDGTLAWRVDLDKLVPAVIDGLAAVCVSSHKESGGRPELMGKSEATWAACYAKVELYLARKRV